MNDILLVDHVGYASLMLQESTGGVCKFTGKFQEANVKNKNQRMYTFEALDSNVKKLQETIDGRGLFGELDHPETSIVHLANASHLVTKIWWHNNSLMGEAEILNTPSGKVLRSLIESGVRVGISSRGVGNGQTNSEGVLVIDESYKLITFDAVADPSTYQAFQSRIVNKHENFTPPEPTKPVQKRVNVDGLISFFGEMLQHKLKEKPFKPTKK